MSEEEGEARKPSRHTDTETGLFIALISGLVTFSAVTFGWNYRERLFSVLPIWLTILAIACAGVGLYLFRSRFRLSYGITETLLGFYASVRVFVPTRFQYQALSATDWLQVVAGLYIMVRGLDNIGKALEGTSWDAGWKRFTGERTR